MKQFKPLSANAYFTLRGELNIDTTCGGIVLLGTCSSDGSIYSTVNIPIRVYVDDQEILIICNAGEPIPAIIAGVGRITKIKFVGSPIRACYI